MKASQRLKHIKAEAEENASLERFAILTNPKRPDLREAIVAWTCATVVFDGDADVPAEATAEELWGLCRFDAREFSYSLGKSIKDTFKIFRQMKSLGMIYPDGTAMKKAIGIIKLFVNERMTELRPKE